MKMKVSVYSNSYGVKVARLIGISKYRKAITLSSNGITYKGYVHTDKYILGTFELERTDVSAEFNKWLYSDEYKDIAVPSQPFKMHKYREGSQWYEYVVIIFDVGEYGKCVMIKNEYISIITLEEYIYRRDRNKWVFEGNIANAFLEWMNKGGTTNVN